MLSQDDLEPAKACLDQGQVWRNIRFKPDLPFFCFDLPVSEQKPEGSAGIDYMIAIWDVLPEQMNDYYSNRFEMLSCLIGRAMDRACLVESLSRE